MQYWYSKHINLGKLKKNTIFLIPVAPANSEIDINFFNLKRKRKLKFNSKINVLPILNSILLPDQVLNNPNNSFWLFSSSGNNYKRRGMILKKEGDKNSRSFHLISIRDLNKYIQELNNYFIDLFEKIKLQNDTTS